MTLVEEDTSALKNCSFGTGQVCLTFSPSTYLCHSQRAGGQSASGPACLPAPCVPVSLLSLGLEGKAKEEYSPIIYVVLGQFHTRQINNRWMEEEDTTIEMLGKTVRTMGMDEWLVGWLGSLHFDTDR